MRSPMIAGATLIKREEYRIIRVQNNDVYTHINDVLDMILMGLEGKL
jgi:very-short-patch-repair endonuclease